jgi:hypothetical protein
MVLTMRIILFWIISVPLIALSLWIITGNLWITFGGLFKKRKSFESLVPFIGGVAGMIGLIFLPVKDVRQFWWLPLLVDLGSGLLLVCVAIDQIQKAVHKNRKKNKTRPYARKQL